MYLFCLKDIFSVVPEGKPYLSFSQYTYYKMEKSDKEIRALNNKGVWEAIWVEGDDDFESFFNQCFKVVS